VFCFELAGAGIAFEREAGLPVKYKGVELPLGFRADIVVQRAVIVEVKAVAALAPPHEAQLRTYLRLSGLRVGLLLNFNEPTLNPASDASSSEDRETTSVIPVVLVLPPC
jgi:GxxExxY protein